MIMNKERRLMRKEGIGWIERLMDWRRKKEERLMNKEIG